MTDTNSKNKCKVFLLSGFLGSGKTTLLQNLLETVPDGESVAVLMNEFGKAGVDGDVVRKKGLEIIEISRGSIFCACAKGDFLKALYTIFKEYNPSVLLVEASGVADTTDIKRDLGQGRLSDFYKLEGNFCLVDALRFENWLDFFTAVIKQVEAASHIIINKIDLVSEEELKKLDKHIREINPDALITHAEYGKVSWSFLLPENKGEEKAEAMPELKEWEKYIEEALKSMDAHLLPPDRLASYSVFWEGDAERFRELLEELPDDIVRSKGYFLDTDKEWKIFDIVEKDKPVYRPAEEGFSMDRNLAIFIRIKRDRREIPALFQNKGLKLLEVRF
ncbi:MAG: GTP-binding protein [Synergistaceae bacterium]|nr:GTP-binding protein [Synergistaceae bacterium]